jgi:general secretion pathway protein M
MIDSLTQKQRQLLALAILALVVVLIFTLTVAPLWAINRHYMDTIDGLDHRLQILQRTASEGSGLRTQHEQLKRALASNRHYLKSTSEALAAANLQGVVKRISGSQGMEVLSTQILPASEEEDFIRVTLKVRMRGALENAVKAFHALETGQPYLFLDNVSIRGHARRIGSYRKGKVNYSKGNVGQMLNVDFDLIGYMQKPSS